MTFSLIIFLYLYFFFLLCWTVLSLVAMYHLLRFGSRMFGSFFLGIIYIAGVIVIAYVSYGFLSVIDWQTEVMIFKNINFSGMNMSPTNSINVFK